MYRSILIFVFILFIQKNIAQSFTVQSNPTLNFLFQLNDEIGDIGYTEKLTLFPLKIGNKQAEFKLIKNKTGLYVLVDGSGQVYKASSLIKNKITFTRIDSTIFFGNTFRSINFSYLDTLFSFGGYGFWHMNGQLRHFTPAAEWNINKLNHTYNTFNQFYSYDIIKGTLYFVEFPRKDEETYASTDKLWVIELNIKERKNRKLGEINPKVNLDWKYFSIDIPSLNGIINFLDRNLYLYSFSKNKVYKLTNHTIVEKLIGKAGYELSTTFEYKNKIYYSFQNDSNLKSISISMNDFTEENYPLYVSKMNSVKIYWKYIFWTLVILMLFTIILILKNRLFNRKEKQEGDFTLYTPDLSSNKFSSLEKELIDKLIQKSKYNQHFTVEEINERLGIKKKSLEIQKRVRTEAINRINHKFNTLFNKNINFIERVRSEEDRRFYKYKISSENANIYLKSLL